MKNKLLNALIIVLIFSSCRKEPQNKRVDNFPEAIELSGEQVLNKYLDVATIQTYDSLLVLTAGMDNFFHIFNNNREHLSSFGRSGRGPTEFLQKPHINGIYSSNSRPAALVYEAELHKTLEVDLLASVSKNELVILNRPELPPKLHQSSLIEYFPIGNNANIGMYEDRFYNQIDRKRNGFYYQAESNNFSILPLKNLELQPYDRMAEANLNNRSMRITPDQSKVAFAMMFYPMVEIFETGSKEPVRYLIDTAPPKEPFELDEFRQGGNINQHFIGLYVNKTHLFLLGTNQAEGPNKEAMQKIYVIDWEGNAVSKFLIADKYKLNSITVDEKNNLIYGISFNNDAIYMFDYGNL